MTTYIRQTKSRCPAIFFFLSVLLCALVFLLPALRPSGVSPSFPPGQPLRAAMARYNQDFLRAAQAAASQHRLIPPGSDGVLIPNWREIAALWGVTGTTPDSLFACMVRLVPQDTALFFPSADGSIPLSPRAPSQVRVVWEGAAEAAPSLSPPQRAALEELLSPARDEEWQALVSGPLTPDPALDDLLSPLSPSLRRSLVEAAAELVGRVGYFWGGKSACVGWDTRWGVPALVTAPGGADTGTVLPYGLDCSGLVSWAAATAAGDPAWAVRVGEGVRAQYAACTPVDWQAVQLGDLLFFPDLSHVGIAAGVAAEGTVQVIHCSHSLGGVVLTADARAAGFTLAGTPPLF